MGTVAAPGCWPVKSFHIQQQLYYVIRTLYRRWIQPRLPRSIDQQRVRLLWFGWGYVPLLTIRHLPLGVKLRFVVRFLTIDWNILHGHRPAEMTYVCALLAQSLTKPGECVVEAGCWQGGGTAKLSLMCQQMGFDLHVYDSFDDVPDMAEREQTRSGYDFSGEYSASQTLVEHHLMQYGAAERCYLHKGLFRETLGKTPVAQPVRLAFLDCDLAESTNEALQGIVPSLSEDGYVVSQDYHIGAVRQLLRNPLYWFMFNKGTPVLEVLSQRLVSIQFQQTAEHEPMIIIHD